MSEDSATCCSHRDTGCHPSLSAFNCNHFLRYVSTPHHSLRWASRRCSKAAPDAKRIRPLGWSAAREDTTPFKWLFSWLCVTGFGPGFLWLGQSGSQRHAAAVMSSFEKFSLWVVRGTIPRHLGRKQPLESALICRNMKASYLSPIAFMEDAWMKAAVGAGWRLRINNDITWRGVCQHSDTSFRLPLSDYPNSSPPMTGMITGRREEHNCQA